MRKIQLSNADPQHSSIINCKKAAVAHYQTHASESKPPSMSSIYNAVVEEDMELLESILKRKREAESVVKLKQKHQLAVHGHGDEESQRTHYENCLAEVEDMKRQLEFRDDDGETALHRAAVAKNIGPHMMKLLLDAGADLSVRDKYGATPLISVLKKADKTLLILCNRLLEYGAEVNCWDDDGVSALLAAWERYAEPWSEMVMVRLLDVGANPNVQWREEGPFSIKKHTALLHWAVNCGNRRLVNKLLEHGADVNVKDSQGQTPLHFAVQNNDSGLSIMMVLLQAGQADVWVTDEIGRTPLMNICMLHYYPYVNRIDVLLDYVAPCQQGIYVNLCDQAGSSALLHACRCQFGASRVLYLLELGADPFVRDTHGFTALIGACRNASSPQWLQIVEYLLRVGVDPNIRDKVSGKPALHHAASQYDVDVQVIHLLLTHGADPCLHIPSGGIPLVLACEGGNASKVYLLLQVMAGKGYVVKQL